MSEWKPIETAPRNGVDVLLTGKAPWGRPRPPVVAASDPEKWGDDKWYSFDDCDTDVDIVPTHWMPLPPPPKAETVTDRVTEPKEPPKDIDGWMAYVQGKPIT